MRILILSLLLLLTGCVTSEYAVREQTFTYPPDSLLQEVDQIPPPSIGYYLESNWSDRENILMGIISAQMSTINKCNNNIQGLQLWKLEHKKLETNK